MEAVEVHVRMLIPAFYRRSGPSVYTPNPNSTYRVKFDFRVDFENGGHVQGEDFLLDLEGDDVADEDLKRMIVEAMNLARAGPVTIYRKQVVRRGEHDDSVKSEGGQTYC
jgi:hypothetical protein